MSLFDNFPAPPNPQPSTPPAPNTSLFSNFPSHPAPTPQNHPPLFHTLNTLQTNAEKYPTTPAPLPSPPTTNPLSLFDAIKPMKPQEPQKPTLSSFTSHQDPFLQLSQDTTPPQTQAIDPSCLFYVADTLRACSKSSPRKTFSPDPLFQPLSSELQATQSAWLNIQTRLQALQTPALIQDTTAYISSLSASGLRASISRMTAPNPKNLQERISRALASYDPALLELQTLQQTLQKTLKKLALWNDILPQLEHHSSPEAQAWNQHLSTYITQFLSPLITQATTLSHQLQLSETQTTTLANSLRTLHYNANLNA